MSTTKQKNLAKLTLENPTMAKGKLVELGGYSKAVQKEPAKALESKGYKQELAVLGLTEEFIAKALIEDIEGKPKRRVRELELGADILGMRNREQDKGDKTLVIMITGETAARYASLPRFPETGSN